MSSQGAALILEEIDITRNRVIEGHSSYTQYVYIYSLLYYMYNSAYSLAS